MEHTLTTESARKLSELVKGPKYQPPDVPARKRRRGTDDVPPGVDIQEITLQSDSHVAPYRVPWGQQPAPYTMSPTVLSGRTGSFATQLPILYSDRISLTQDAMTGADPLTIYNPRNFVWHAGDKAIILQDKSTGDWEIISVSHQFIDRILFRLTVDAATGHNSGQSPHWAWFGSTARALIGEALGPASQELSGELPNGLLTLWDVYYKFPGAKANDTGIAFWNYREKRWEIEECTHIATRLFAGISPSQAGAPTDVPGWVKVYSQVGYDGRYPNVSATGNAASGFTSQFFAYNRFGFNWSELASSFNVELAYDFFFGYYYILQTQRRSVANPGSNPNNPTSNPES